MKKVILAVLFGGTLLASGVSNAGAAWTGWYPVSQVYTYSDGSVFIALNPSSAHSNPDACASASWLRVPAANINNKEAYQMALTAQASGMKINAYVSGCDGSYPRVYHLRSLSQ